MPLGRFRHGGACEQGRKYMSVDDQKYGCHNNEAFDNGSDGLFHFSFLLSFPVPGGPAGIPCARDILIVRV